MGFCEVHGPISWTRAPRWAAVTTRLQTQEFHLASEFAVSPRPPQPPPESSGRVTTSVVLSQGCPPHPRPAWAPPRRKEPLSRSKQGWNSRTKSHYFLFEPLPSTGLTPPPPPDSG